MNTRPDELLTIKELLLNERASDFVRSLMKDVVVVENKIGIF
jgi:hypothetical protein